MPKVKKSAAGPNTADAVGRGIQLLALLSGSVAIVMTMYVMPTDDRSTAPSLGLALLSGAAFTIGWLIQRHFGTAAAQRK